MPQTERNFRPHFFQKLDNAIHWINRYRKDNVIGFSDTYPLKVIYLAPVVEEMDSAVHRINLYPVDSAIGFPNTYPLDSDLSGG